MGDTTAKAATAIIEVAQLKKQLSTALTALDRTQRWLDEFQGSLADKEIEYLRVKTENQKLYALLVKLKVYHGFYRVDDSTIDLCPGDQDCSCGAAAHNAKIEAAIRGEL